VFTNPDTATRYTDVKKYFSAACWEAGITNFTFHDLRHTFGTRLADAGVDVVKIKELMGHASIGTTMRYIHATDQGKRGAIIVLSEYRQKRRHKIVSTTKRQAFQPAVIIPNSGEPSRARTCDPLIKSQLLYQLSYRPIV